MKYKALQKVIKEAYLLGRVDALLGSMHPDDRLPTYENQLNLLTESIQKFHPKITVEKLADMVIDYIEPTY